MSPLFSGLQPGGIDVALLRQQLNKPSVRTTCIGCAQPCIALRPPVAPSLSEPSQVVWGLGFCEHSKPDVKLTSAAESR